MQAKLLAMLIAKAGPRLAKMLALAILKAASEAANKTETDIDDRIVTYVIDMLEERDILDFPE